MKFRTRLRVTFAIIIVLPLMLTAVAFCGIGLYLMNVHQGFPVVDLDYTAMTENMREVVNGTEEVYLRLRKQVEEEPSKLADKEYLDTLSARITHRTTYIIVRKDDELYYTGN